MAIPRKLGYVYFVLSRASHKIKIGYSAQHPDCRLMAFRVGCPVPLERFGYLRAKRDMELRLHRKFRHYSTHGEWFHADEVIVRYVEENATEWKPRDRKLVLPPPKPYRGINQAYWDDLLVTGKLQLFA